MLFDYPLIKDIKVEYDMPGKLIVQIEERTPVMMTEKDGMYLYIDSEGYLLGTYTEADKPDMPLIKGVDIKDYKIGASIADGKNVYIDNECFDFVFLYCSMSVCAKSRGAKKDIRTI